MMLFQNNLEAEAQLAGYGFFPPIVFHSTVRLALLQNSLQDEP